MFSTADAARQALDLSKATFDNVYFTLDTLQHMSEDWLLANAREAEWMPAELVDVLCECAGLFRRSRADLKETMDRCHRRLHDLVDRTASERPAATEAAATAAR